MQFTPTLLERLSDRYEHLKAPGALRARTARRDEAVVERVSAMLREIERRGMDAVRDYARELDNQGDRPLELPADQLAGSGEQLPTDLKKAIELGSTRTKAFAQVQRDALHDVEVELSPGLVTGSRYLPVGSVGAYLPAGQFPLTASAFMTVGVAKVAGVNRVVACTPPQPNGSPNWAVVYAAAVSGVDRVFVLGGVQALAAMAFGLLAQEEPVDMLVGAGNAYVAEAKRQLFGPVAIDVLAGPSEVAVIAGQSADPVIVAADLLGQAEHGPSSPAALVTTDRALGEAVLVEVDRQLADLSTNHIAGPAWRDHGTVTVAADRETAALLMDDLAPEHLELLTAEDDWYHDRLRNYGSMFIGPWSTVAYSDKGMAGTNHTLPTAGGAKHTSGLSVSRFLKGLTYQRVSRNATPLLAPAVQTISDSEGMAAHSATATLRLKALQTAGDDDARRDAERVSPVQETV